MKKIFFIYILLFFPPHIKSQTVLLEEVVENYTVKNWGKNCRHFGHFHCGLGFMPKTSSNSIKTKKTHYYSIGYRYKFKLARRFSIGMDLHPTADFYSLKTSNKNITCMSIYNDFFARIILNKVGNNIGNYIDFGLSGILIYNLSHTNIYTYGDRTIKSRTYIKEYNKFNYGIILRLGFDNFAIIAGYRFSDIQKDKMPPLNIGVELSFF